MVVCPTASEQDSQSISVSFILLYYRYQTCPSSPCMIMMKLYVHRGAPPFLDPNHQWDTNLILSISLSILNLPSTSMKTILCYTVVPFLLGNILSEKYQLCLCDSTVNLITMTFRIFISPTGGIQSTRFALSYSCCGPVSTNCLCKVVIC